MSAEEIATSVETIEIEAERKLEEARKRANEIALNAREEASRILAAEVSLGEAKKEYEQILDKAREKAKQEVETAQKTATEIKSTTGKRTGGIVKHIVNVVTGVEQA